ncbi:DNLI4-like protein, partial [Mya arenaria]
MDAADQGPKSPTVASKVHFAELCGLLEKISKTQGNDKKKKILKDFVGQWRKSHETLHGKDAQTTDSFHPAMRLLLPHLEKERIAYGIKEHMFAKLLIEVLCLGKDSQDAQRLLNFKSPKSAKAKDIVRKHIVRLITNMSALELKWLTRMIVKELKIGLSQASVLSVFHPDAEEFYNVNNNLEKVCRMMHDPSVRIHEIGITVDKLMEGKPYYIETKFDGERMVLHKDGGDYKFYSRSGNEHTGVFGSNQFDGNLVPYIHNIFKPDLQSSTKAMNTDVKTVNKDGFQPCLHVFDIMLYNGRVLTNLPLRERLPFLEKAFTPQDCADALNEAIDGREEGIMVKNPESVYRPNTRKGGWFKVKPEYVGDGDKPELFYSFCKIGSGYSKKELRDFNAKLVDHWQAFDKKNPPRCIELASGFKEKPDAWIDPSKSAIVQIKAAEIIDSERFRCGFTLRFPRVEKFRDDKHWYECMTFEEKSGGKLAGGYVELGGEEEPVKKKRKVVSRAVRPTLGSQFRAADTSDVKQLETKIVECGGTVIQNPGAETYCVIVEKVNFRVSSMIKSNRYDIVRAEWLIRCFDANTLKP